MPAYRSHSAAEKSWYLHDEKASRFCGSFKGPWWVLLLPGREDRLVEKSRWPSSRCRRWHWLTITAGDRIAHCAPRLDAQGSDVALIESVRVALPWVRRARQARMPRAAGGRDGFMYRSEVPNRCSRAEQASVPPASSSSVERRLNNCGCEEYNLFMVMGEGSNDSMSECLCARLRDD